MQGGSVEIKFDIDNKSVASVDIFREVTGHEVGTTHLFYEIVQNKPSKTTGMERKSIVSKKQIPIRVRLISSIEIPNNDNRVIFKGSMVKLIGILKFQNETFTHGVAPISYGWNCSSPALVEVQMPNKDGVQIIGANIVMSSKKLRDNSLNKND